MAQSDVVQSSSRVSQTGAPGAGPAGHGKVGPAGFITSWRNFIFIIIALAALAYGWRVTQVDFVSLVVNLPKSQRIFTGLMQPDVLTQVTEVASVQAALQVGGVAAVQPSSA